MDALVCFDVCLTKTCKVLRYIIIIPIIKKYIKILNEISLNNNNITFKFNQLPSENTPVAIKYIPMIKVRICNPL